MTPPAKTARVTEILHALGAVVLALGIGAVLMAASGYNVVTAYGYLLTGAFGNFYNISQTLLKMIPLIFTGLSVAIAFRSGLFNIGAEGQLYWGAFATAVVAIRFPHTGPAVLVPLSLIAGAAAGGAWGMIPGYLKAKTGAHEVVTTIMLNTIGILATGFLLRVCFKEAGPVDQTPLIPESARLGELIPYTRLTWALFVGIGAVLLTDLMFKRTALGYELQAVGDNLSAAQYAGIDADRMLVVSMTLSGLTAGLAGSTLVLGVLHRFITNFSPGYGFVGIAVAVLGRNTPWGVLSAAFLFGALDAGGISMQLFARIPMDLMTMVQGLVILFVAAPFLIRRVFRRGKER